MTRRSLLFSFAGTVASGFLSRLPASTPPVDLTGWTLFSLRDTFLETRLIFRGGWWVEIFQFKRVGDMMMLNPDWDSATHETYAAIDPAGKHFVLVHERGTRPQGCEIKRPEQFR